MLDNHFTDFRLPFGCLAMRWGCVLLLRKSYRKNGKNGNQKYDEKPSFWAE